MNNVKYQWLDLLRGISALLVCANHLRAAMFVDYSVLENSSQLVKLFYFLTGLGSQSVIVFFVLSGFFVGGSVIKKQRFFKYYDYLLARLVRLWIVLVPALFFTLVIDQLIAELVPVFLLGEDFAVINSGPDGYYSTSVWTFFQNLLFLQTVSAPVFGSNGPLWSLSNEFWYYICFPILFFAFAGKFNIFCRVVSIFFVVALGFLMQDKVIGFFVWMIGAGVYSLPRWRRLAWPMLMGFVLLLFIMTLVISKLHLLPDSFDMIIVGCSAGLLIMSLRTAPAMPLWLAKPTNWLASISYTLYLVHFPIVMLIYVLFFRDKQVYLNVLNFATFAVFLAFLLIIGYGFWYVFEKHTERVRERLSALLR